MRSFQSGPQDLNRASTGLQKAQVRLPFPDILPELILQRQSKSYRKGTNLSFEGYALIAQPSNQTL